MEIYFLRHGETIWNRERRLQGCTPHTDLTDFGVKLAESTRDEFISRGLFFDRVYTSPLLRARHTAEIVMEKQSCPLVVDERLHEMSFGKYEGTRISDGFFIDDNIRACFRDPLKYVARDGAESFANVDARICGFMENELKPLECSCDKVLVVSHGGVMRALICTLRHLPVEVFWSGRQPNCCIHHVSLNNGEFTIVEEGLVMYDKNISASVLSV